ncbi:metal ABC transporter ATP-binding protein [Streptomyces sp. NPDC088725]|uniref:metal ABC transporter ATP-binding protein n=1 Tax=Streptomyces sp. NPDC088725 TaxID=3365873 RepID=UPI0037F88CEF
MATANTEQPGKPGQARDTVPDSTRDTAEDAQAGPVVISVRAATAELGSRPVLRGLDLTVRRGEVVALLGANGSGKSTAVRSVIGQVPLSGGEISLFSTPLRRFRDWARVGYVPQRTTAASGVPATVREVVSSGRLSRRKLRRPGKADREAVQRAIELVGLADRARDSVGALSGGQHQRVLIARALAAAPELLIMDEPMAGVDLASQEILAATLRDQVAAGTTVLLVLHELGPLEPLIDRTVVLRDGGVVYDGPPVAHGHSAAQGDAQGHEHGYGYAHDDAGIDHGPGRSCELPTDRSCHPHEAGEPLRTGLLT